MSNNVTGLTQTFNSPTSLKNVGDSYTPGPNLEHSLEIYAGALSIAECKFSLTGLAVTGATFETDAQCAFHLPNQLTTIIEKDFEYQSPIVFRQNEGLVLQSSGAVVLGTNISIAIQYYEV